MSKQYSFPKGHWNWPIELSHQHAVRAGDLIFTGGQASLDSNGTVLFIDSLQQQTMQVLDYIDALLVDLDAAFNDIVKLICYFTGDAESETHMLELISERFGKSAKPVINTVLMPELCYPGMRVEIEAVALSSSMSVPSAHKRYWVETLPRQPFDFPHVIRCGELVFTGDITGLEVACEGTDEKNLSQQTSAMMDNLQAALAAAGCEMQDVVKLNVFYQGDGTAENWEQPAQIRASYFNDPGPAATGLAVNTFAQPGLVTKIFCTAMRSTDDKPMQKTYSWPEGHWDWTAPLPYKHGNVCGRMIHLGGQVSLDQDANVVNPENMPEQTRTAMNNIETVLHDLGASLKDVVKVTAFYQGNASAADLHENLMIRSACYSKPGPATTGIPVPFLVYENMVIEIEVIAVVDQ